MKVYENMKNEELVKEIQVISGVLAGRVLGELEDVATVEEAEFIMPFKDGDKVRFVGEESRFNEFVTKNKVYVIDEVSKCFGRQTAHFVDDSNMKKSRSMIRSHTINLFEKVEEDTDILPLHTANIACYESEG